ncbi:MAG: hypothetical protein IPK19_13185 [Chloroflexi bacterium]|nr:hypothetical protein [Chloroflexota bacterium]
MVERLDDEEAASAVTTAKLKLSTMPLMDPPSCRSKRTPHTGQRWFILKNFANSAPWPQFGQRARTPSQSFSIISFVVTPAIHAQI